MPWPCAGSGADSWDCLSGGGAQRLSSIRQRPEPGVVVGPNRVTPATASPACRALPWPQGPAMLSRDAVVTGRPASAAVRHL